MVGFNPYNSTNARGGLPGHGRTNDTRPQTGNRDVNQTGGTFQRGQGQQSHAGSSSSTRGRRGQGAYPNSHAQYGPQPQVQHPNAMHQHLQPPLQPPKGPSPYFQPRQAWEHHLSPQHGVQCLPQENTATPTLSSSPCLLVSVSLTLPRSDPAW
jgi:hypothetical protein